MLPATFIIPLGFLAGWVAKNHKESTQMEDIRVELKVQQRLGQVPSIKLPEHRVVQLAKERESLIQEIHRLEAQQRDRVEQRQRLSARHGNQSETQ